MRDADSRDELRWHGIEFWPWPQPQEQDELSWPEQLRNQVATHMSTEGKVLAEYQALADQCESADIRYLIGILLDDERRHHHWFEQLRATLDSAIDLREREDAVPHLEHGPADPALLEVTERMLAIEKEDAQELELLRKKLRPVAQTTMWHLLVDLMERDTQKHIRVLEFIRGIVKERVRESA